MVGCSKKSLENFPKRLLNREVKKPELKFNPVLALIGLEQLGPAVSIIFSISGHQWCNLQLCC